MGIQVSLPTPFWGKALQKHKEPRIGFLFVHTTKPLTHPLALL